MAAHFNAITKVVRNAYSVAVTSALDAANPKKSDPAITYQPLAVGTLGTFQTLDAMAQSVRGEIGPDFSGWQDEVNQRAAHAIVRSSGADDINALFYFVRDQILYIAHPWNMQVIQDCRRTLEFKSGDCVSKSVCLATLLASRGRVSRFVAQAPNGEDHDHVYCEVYDGGRWLALDPTADGREGRPLGNVGWFQVLPDGGFESTGKIFQ